MIRKFRSIAPLAAVLVWLILGFLLMIHGEYRNPETGEPCRPYYNDPRDGDSLDPEDIAPCKKVGGGLWLPKWGGGLWQVTSE